LRFRDLLTLVFGNLIRLKTRLIMTAGGVLIGSAAVLLLIALGLGLQRNALESLGDVGDLSLLRVYLPQGVEFSILDPRLAGEIALLNSNTLEEIAAWPGVVGITPQVHVRTSTTLRLSNLEAYSPVFGVDTQQLHNFNLELASGRLDLGPGQAILGAKSISNLFDPRKKEYVPETLEWQDSNADLILTRYFDDASMETKRHRLQVVGVLEETGGFIDYGIFVPIEEAVRWNAWIDGKPFDHNRYGYESIWVKSSNASDAYQIEQTLSEMTFRVDTNRKMLAQLDQFFQFIKIMLGGIGAIALLVSAFGIANTMIMSIYERTREIGLLKALGARNIDILMIFICEAALIGLLGGMGGVLFAFTLARLSNHFGATWLSRIPNAFGPPGSIPGLSGAIIFEIPAWLIGFAIAFSTFVGIFSGIYPAMRAASLDPLAALRHE
jgi:putative ABC transport system permease protein